MYDQGNQQRPVFVQCAEDMTVNAVEGSFRVIKLATSHMAHCGDVAVDSPETFGK